MAQAKRKSEEQRVRSFCNAAAIGDMDQINRLLSSGVSIDATDANNRWAPAATSALHRLGRWTDASGHGPRQVCADAGHVQR